MSITITATVTYTVTVPEPPGWSELYAAFDTSSETSTISQVEAVESIDFFLMNQIKPILDLPNTRLESLEYM